MVSNPYHFSRLGTTVSAQLTDGVDAPHTGLIKALSVYSTGSYPVKTSTDFNITAATKSAINITSGRVVRDGELQAAITAGSSIAIGSTSAGKTYSLVVVDSSNAFAVRTTTTDNVVPEMSNGDIPIAIVLFTDDTSTMEFQYFTNRKESHTLSVAYANSNVYTEILEMKGNAGNVELTGSALTDISSLDSANDRLLVRDATNNQLKLVAPDDVGGGGGATEDADGDTKIQVEESADEDKIRFDTAGSERMIIDDAGNVGIGTSSPTEKLHLSDADGTEPTILIENTGTDSNEPEIVFLRSTATGADSRDIGNIKFKAKDTAGNLHTFAQIMADSLDADTGTEDGRIVFSLTQAGTDHVEFFSMGNLESVFNNGGEDINFRVEGDSEANLLFVDAGNDKVGIGTNTPSEVLTVQGNIRSSGNVIVGGDLDHNGSNIGFFGTAVQAKQTVGNMGTTAVQPTPAVDPTATPGFEAGNTVYLQSLESEITNLRDKLDLLIDKLQLYGLIS